MRIKNIELHNFGSYGGHNSFNFESNTPKERIVVIGGKNGAGKTTLFTATQICFYGNFAFGFKTAGKRYLNEIYNLIHSSVRINENESAFIEISFQQVDNQSKNELPFIIDTPFARIDAEHRANITEYFFKKLTGQLVILSTDEELSHNHLEAMRDQISHVYMLEYGQDKRTYIRENQYFEV